MDDLSNLDLDLDLDGLIEAPTQTEPPRVNVYPMEFTGSTGEFFRIWIVNLFLSVVTLGIYYAWAKVRARQYLYSNTRLAGYSFEYLGNPVALLKGNLIVAGGMLAFYLSQTFAPYIAGAGGLIFALIYPFLIHSSLRFLAANSAYRNIRFRFHGTLRESYTSYFGLNLLLPFTLGLIFPYIQWRQKKFLFDNAAYGTTRVNYKGESGAFYRIYFQAGLIWLGMMVVVAIIGGLIAAAAGTSLSNPDGLFLILIPIYLMFFLSVSVAGSYAYAGVMHYSFENCQILSGQQKTRIDCNLKAREVMWLRFTNLLAIVCSLGLLIPWTKVRFLKYVVSKTVVTTYGTLEDFSAGAPDIASALGDAATDFFNVDVGL